MASFPAKRGSDALSEVKMLLFQEREIVTTSKGPGVVVADCPRTATTVLVRLTRERRSVQLPVRAVDSTGKKAPFEPKVKPRSTQRSARGGPETQATYRRFS